MLVAFFLRKIRWAIFFSPRMSLRAPAVPGKNAPMSGLLIVVRAWRRRAADGTVLAATGWGAGLAGRGPRFAAGSLRRAEGLRIGTSVELREDE